MRHESCSNLGKRKLGPTLRPQRTYWPRCTWS